MLLHYSPLLLLLLSLFGCQSPDPESAVSSGETTPTKPLAEAFSGAFRVGTALNEAIVAGVDTASRRVVIKHFNAVTPENVMKAGPLTTGRDAYDFTAADAFADFAQKQGFFTIGHTLIWHNQTPEWFFTRPDGSPNTPSEQAEQLRSHIATVAGRYAGRVDAWDVLNEVIDNDGSYRPTTWVEGIGDGDELARLAFRYAAQYAPDTELYYNDFNAWRPAKRDGIVRMVRMLQAAGIRIDGIGIQGHWGLNFPKTEYIEAAIDSFAALGVKVMITELDVDVLPLTREGQIIGTGMLHPQFELEEFETYLDPYPDGLPPEVEQALSDRYAELFSIFYRKRDKIDRVTLWGVHDDMSWKNGYPIANRTNYPLLFDRERRAKPAVRAVAEVPNTAN